MKRRTLVLAILAIALLGAAIVFVVLRAPSTDERLTSPAGARDSQLCWKLAERYRAAWARSAVCIADHECVAEPRSGEWSELDDCHRVGAKHASHAEAEAIARDWRALGCVDLFSVATHERCPPLPAAQCMEGRCVERPPEPIPGNWKRYTIRHVLRLFIPPDFAEPSIMYGDIANGVFYNFDGDRRRLAITFLRQSVASKDNPREDDWVTFGAARPIRIGGYEATLFDSVDAVKWRLVDAGPRYSRSAWLDNVGVVAPVGLWALEVGFAAQVSFTMGCDSHEACEPIKMILETADVLAIVGRASDGGGDR